MIKRLALLALLFTSLPAWAAINGVPVQVIGDDFGVATSETIDSGDSWATPTSGNKLITVTIFANSNVTGVTCPTGFSEQQAQAYVSSAAHGHVCTKTSDGTETSLVSSWTSDSFRGNFVAIELAATDLASGGPVATAEDVTEITTESQTAAAPSVTNTVADALFVHIFGIKNDQSWDDDSYDTCTERGDKPEASSSTRPGVRVATTVASTIAARSCTNTTTDVGDTNYNLSLVYDGVAATCSSDDTSPIPGATIAATCPAFAGAITTLTSPQGDTISAESGATTTAASFIIPARDNFASGQSMDDTRWDVDGTWTVGDGSTTTNLTMQVDPPATAGTDFFGQITRTSEPPDSIWPDCCSSAVDNDDYYFEENSGAISITTYGVVSGSGEGDVRWYDVSLTAWSSITTDTYSTDVTAPVLSSPVASEDDIDAATINFAWDTDEAGGEGYWAVCTEASRTCAQIQAGTCTGQTNTGSPLTPTLGTNETQTTELEGGTYYGHSCQDDASSNESNVVTSSSVTFTGSPPTVISAVIAANGTAVTITGNENLNVGSGGNGGFSMECSGGTATLTYSSGDGTAALVYTAGRTIGDDETDCNLDFTQPGNGIEDDVGNDMATFVDFSVTNNSSTGSPDLVSATVNTAGTTISYLFDEAVTIGAGGNAGFTLTLSGGAATATYSSGDGSTTLVYSISRIIFPDETGTTDYVQPTNGVEADDDNEDVASFSDQAVVNGSLQAVPTLAFASVNPSGNSITFTLNEAGNVGSGGNGGFSAAGSHGAIGLTYSSGDGTNQLVYTTSRTIRSLETSILAAYVQPTDGIEDAVGLDLASFSDQAVTNGSTVVGSTYFQSMADRNITNDDGSILPEFSRTGNQTGVTTGGLLEVVTSGPAYVGNEGILLEAAATNLMLRSETFDNASWVKVGTPPTVSANSVTSPAGAGDADSITLGAGDVARQNVNVTAGATYTFSAWVKKPSVGGATAVRLTTNNTSAWNTGISAKHTLTESWQRVSLSGVVISSGTAGYFMIGAKDAANGNDADCVGIVEVWGAQLETGAFATSYIPTAGSTVTRNATDLDDIDLSALGLDDRTDEFAFHVVVKPNFAHNADKGAATRILTVNDGSTSDFLEVYFDQTDDQIHLAIVTNSTTAELASTTLNDLQYSAGDVLNIRAKKDSGGISLWVNALTQVDNSNANADADWAAAITTASINEDESGNKKADMVVAGFTLYDYANTDAFMLALTATAFDPVTGCRAVSRSSLGTVVGSTLGLTACSN